MNRLENIQKLNNEEFDICIIGAGASGAGCALDATLRGFKVALIEKNDFAAETSSKSTKLIHGGVRYLEQAFKNLDLAQLKQVRHGLEERHILLSIAPHLAHPLGLITPVFSWIEGLYFTIGLKIYGFFAKNDPLPQAKWLSNKETFEHIPTLTKKLHSSVLYYDGQLDDARFCLALAQTASESGAVIANHTEVVDFQKDSNGKLLSATIKDLLSDEKFTIKSKLFINCTGPFADSIRLMANTTEEKRLRPSKGVHIMLPSDVLKSENAMLIPKTKDGRVVFVIPFEGETMVGTTDDEYKELEKEPILIEKEVDFLLETLERFLARTPNKSEIKAGFGGLRPLIGSSGSKATKKLVRDHEVEHDEKSNLLSLLGGKWTTYRLMAKDTIDDASKILEVESECKTDNKLLVGAENYVFRYWETLVTSYNLEENSAKHLMKKYGSRAEEVCKIAKTENLISKIHKDYPFIEAEVVYGVRFEMVCKLRDFFARRIRLELMDWSATYQSIEKVADLMATELNWNTSKKKTEITEYQQLIKEFSEKSGVKL